MLSNATRVARLRGVKGSSGVYKRTFGRSCPSLSHQPSAPIQLDPNTQSLLSDMALRQNPATTANHRELTAVPVEFEERDVVFEGTKEIIPGGRLDRKSPAAIFGSQQFGQVVMPMELQEAIGSIIEGSDKKMLRSDAKRLFSEVDEEGQQTGWQVEFDSRYRSRKQGERHAERDALAFASVALPAHYSAIFTVFEHMKHRLGPNWEVDRVLDWGSGCGSGLWASLFSFQPPHRSDMLDIESAKSTIRSYVGIDKRQGLVTTAKKILDVIPTSENLSVKFHKTFSQDERGEAEQANKTIALSAFVLSTLPTTLARKALVKEMWESGADTLVLIDHSTREGFDVIGQAREYLLRRGRKEVAAFEAESLSASGEADAENRAPSNIKSTSTPRGSYVVAPCPHDGACPLLSNGSSRLVCGFSQRLQRPAFVRLTKHSGVGHEDVGYSYTVIKRGGRPTRATSQEGRVGLVGRRAEEEKGGKILRELELYQEGLEPAELVSEPTPTPTEIITSTAALGSIAAAELDDTLRQEAYHWPRLVFPPMKKSGHIILDSCTAEGKIMRMTVPRSQGKQPYYDARKSSWGDLFPHPPKNAPQERIVVRDGEGNVKRVQRDHIGKSQKSSESPNLRISERLATTIREAKKVNRRWERNLKAGVVWGKD
ncbi:3-methyl-2-oxobutanoate hydroxymethyltransferase [Coprinopsis marcescibilis]|uniref:3-methyl-2-oxobutanoate hydroxymethyltransferase n=1 Tax=Coprinopsis marcescibilis TaxID=230819 RepID=A0A5C3L1B0_COPMA|nr:3-methyl-2-oxobutanoate hydroxymethyltransferase [Coprinopsis marcescibilis]